MTSQTKFLSKPYGYWVKCQTPFQILTPVLTGTLWTA